MARVLLESVSKTYPGGVTAVAPMSLEIADGEFIVLVGPSGCGKSTTLRMIAGLEDATAGTISIGDRVVNDVEPKDRQIAMVFQSYALYPHMTVRQNLAFGLRMRKSPRAEIVRRVEEVARTLGIAELLDRKPRELSGGQRQRVALGRAIVRDPDVFLFDEPLSNLDAKMRVQMRTEISRLHHRLGATMVYVTHDQVEAMTLGQRIVVMDAGLVQQVAPPLELYERPANRFVAGFIGSPAMNFLRGRIVRNDGPRFAVEDDAGRAAAVLPLPADFSPPPEAVERPVVLGIRPEHVRVTGDDDPHAGAASALRLPLLVGEQLGNETLLYFELAGQPFVVRTAGSVTAEVDEEVPLSLDGERLQLFAADGDGRNLVHPSGPADGQRRELPSAADRG
ncbi:MAG: sn-glycerol-3-phosphate ABC transporter ATP-binding protein UgpC [Candidatus Krumholzibacteriia bacterium]